MGKIVSLEGYLEKNPLKRRPQSIEAPLPDNVWLYSVSLEKGPIFKIKLPAVSIEMFGSSTFNPRQYERDTESLKVYLKSNPEPSSYPGAEMVEPHSRVAIAAGLIGVIPKESRSQVVHLVISHWRDSSGDVQLDVGTLFHHQPLEGLVLRQKLVSSLATMPEAELVNIMGEW